MIPTQHMIPTKYMHICMIPTKYMHVCIQIKQQAMHIQNKTSTFATDCHLKDNSINDTKYTILLA